MTCAAQRAARLWGVSHAQADAAAAKTTWATTCHKSFELRRQPVHRGSPGCSSFREATASTPFDVIEHVVARVTHGAQVQNASQSHAGAQDLNAMHEQIFGAMQENEMLQQQNEMLQAQNDQIAALQAHRAQRVEALVQELILLRPDLQYALTDALNTIAEERL